MRRLILQAQMALKRFYAVLLLLLRKNIIYYFQDHKRSPVRKTFKLTNHPVVFLVKTVSCQPSPYIVGFSASQGSIRYFI